MVKPTMSTTNLAGSTLGNVVGLTMAGIFHSTKVDFLDLKQHSSSGTIPETVSGPAWQTYQGYPQSSQQHESAYQLHHIRRGSAA